MICGFVGEVLQYQKLEINHTVFCLIGTRKYFYSFPMNKIEMVQNRMGTKTPVEKIWNWWLHNINCLVYHRSMYMVDDIIYIFSIGKVFCFDCIVISLKFFFKSSTIWICSSSWDQGRKKQILTKLQNAREFLIHFFPCVL